MRRGMGDLLLVFGKMLENGRAGGKSLANKSLANKSLANKSLAKKPLANKSSVK
jgi:hypothetical protein